MRSLRSRLARRVAAGLLAVLLLAIAWAYSAGTRALERQFLAGHRLRVELFMTMLDQEGDESELDLVAAGVVQRSAGGSSEFAQFWRRAEGGDWVPLWRTQNLAADLPLRFGPDCAEEIWDAALPDGRAGRWIGVETPIRKVEPDDAGVLFAPQHVVVVVGVDKSGLVLAKHNLLLGLAGAALVLVLSAGAIAWLVVGRGLAPLERFAGRVRALDVATLAEPLDPGDHPSELAPVIASLNDLRARVDAALRREKRLGATIAHEFRTPFSELCALTEVALQDAGDVAFVQRALVQVHDIASRLTELLGLIRSLASIEHHTGELASEPIAVAELVEDILRGLAPAAAERGQSVVCNGLAGWTSTVNRVALATVVTNLLANAVEYAPRASEIVCSAAAGEGQTLLLCVQNASPDLRPELLDRLREPFWRGNAARSDPRHHGLGLSIAEGMAGLAGIGLQIVLAEGRLTVKLTLPRSTHKPVLASVGAAPAAFVAARASDVLHPSVRRPAS